MTDHAYLNLTEATDYLHLEKVSTLQALARRKKITHTKIGRSIVFRTDWLDAFTDQHRIDIETNPWGLSDQAAENIRNARPESTRRAS